MDFAISFPQTLPTPAFLPSQSLSRGALREAVGELLLEAKASTKRCLERSIALEWLDPVGVLGSQKAVGNIFLGGPPLNSFWNVACK